MDLYVPCCISAEELFCQFLFNGFHQVLELLGSITDGSMHQFTILPEQVNPRNALVSKQRKYFTLRVWIQRESELLPFVVFLQIGIRMLPTDDQQLEIRIVLVLRPQHLLHLS